MTTASPCCRPTLAALALFAATAFATTAGHAQGLVGMLNQTKAKVNRATNGATPGPSRVTPAAT